MRVVLFHSVPNVGLAGDVIEVKPGFYRNYLEPRGFAMRETPAALRLLASKKKKIEQALLKEKSQAEEAEKTLSSMELTFRLKAGDKGRLFGSVTNRDIAEALEKKGVIIERHKIELPEAVKSIGAHVARIRLHPQVIAELKINVESDAPVAAPVAPPPSETEAPSVSPKAEAEKGPDAETVGAPPSD